MNANRLFFTAKEWVGRAISAENSRRRGERPWPNPFLLSMVSRGRKLGIGLKKKVQFFHRTLDQDVLAGFSSVHGMLAFLPMGFVPISLAIRTCCKPPNPHY